MPPLILVVEDEPTVQRAICRMLELYGYDSIGASTPAEAFAFFEAGHTPDLMVIDVRLPQMSGPELALRIHSLHPRMPVLFVSGWVDGLADSALLDAMHWAFLQKPFEPHVMAATLERMLRSVAPVSEQSP